MRECMWCDDCGLCRCDGGGCGLCVCVCVCCGWSPHRPGTLSEQNCLAGQQAGERLGGAEQKTSQGYIERIEYYSPVRPALSTLLFSVSGARKVQWASGISGAGGAQDREGKGELTAVCRGWRNFGVRADSGWIREGNWRLGSRRLKSAVKFGCRHLSRLGGVRWLGDGAKGIRVLGF